MSGDIADIPSLKQAILSRPNVCGLNSYRKGGRWHLDVEAYWTLPEELTQAAERLGCELTIWHRSEVAVGGGRRIFNPK